MATDYLRAAPNVNHLWARLLVEELVRQGVTAFFVGPGSRSTPLAVAVAEHPETAVTVHVDERGGAFAALGWARATGRPAALVTTSGTAVANAVPAAVEADAEGVPLLLLTADRPPELRETGANQTIRQPGFFAHVARWAFDLPVPDAAVPPAFVLTTAAQVVHRSLHPPGPVHLNLPFREPLAPVAGGAGVEGLLDGLGRWLGAIHADMQARARKLGARLVDAEAELEHLFQSGAATTDSMAVLLDRIGRLEAELRGVHLSAHIEQRAVLTTEQVQRYVQLRGYGHAQHGSHGHHH